MIMSGWHMAVLVPARNEEDLLPRCLHSLRRARLALPKGISTDVIIVDDCSTDRTAAIAATLLARPVPDAVHMAGAVARADCRAVGAARAMAAACALGRAPLPAERCWLANTDADCIVPEDWLLQQLTLARQGVAGAAGIVDVDSFAEHGQEVEQRFRLTYLLSADGTHTHVHGANLGVRGDAYLLAGGWSSCRTGEDHHLWRRLRRTGLPLRATTTLRVTTSGRRQGRAPAGFADALAAHNESAAQVTA